MKITPSFSDNRGEIFDIFVNSESLGLIIPESTALRISVTDRCDLRCKYCMPLKNDKFFKKDGCCKKTWYYKYISILPRSAIWIP